MNIGLDSTTSLKVFQSTVNHLTFTFLGKGDNSIQEVVLADAMSVLSISFSVTGTFVIRFICFYQTSTMFRLQALP